MRRFVKKGIALFVALATLMSLMSMTVSAAGNKTVEVKGYTQEGMTNEEIAKLPAQFSVSNVTGTFDAKKVDPSINAGLIVASPSKITTIEDNLVIFDVYRLTKIGATMYSYDDAKALPVTGNKSGDEDMPYYKTGCSVEITDPGDYLVVARREAEAGAAMAIINIPYKNLTISKNDAVYDKATKTYFVPAKKVAALMNGSVTVSKGSATIKTKLDTMTFKVGAKAITINTYTMTLKTINGKMIKNELYIPVSIIDYFGCKATVK